MNAKYKILNVDDNDQGRYLITRQLRHAGFDVMEATTGRSALNLLSEKPDVVLLDVNLPDINGMEICRQIKADPKSRSTIVIHMSATTIGSLDKARGLEGGADAYLAEPVEPRELVATIRAMIRIYEAETKALELSQKLESQVDELNMQKNMRERFVNALSHDLRGPLSAIGLSAQLMRRISVLEPDARELVGRIESNVNRMNGMIEDLLDANRIRAGESLPIRVGLVALNGVLSKIVEELSLMHGDRFVLSGPSDIVGNWDGNAIRRVVENFCSNAVKYGDPEAKISITQSSTAGGDVTISVRNRGPVILEADQQTIFDQFAQGHSSAVNGQRGWGIGLALVKGIAEAHKGRVWVESSEDKGTIFAIFLPRESH